MLNAAALNTVALNGPPTEEWAAPLAHAFDVRLLADAPITHAFDVRLLADPVGGLVRRHFIIFNPFAPTRL